MRIAYLVNQYPKISHSFIRREILALERLGFEVIRIAHRGYAGEVVDEVDHIERKRTRYVLREGALGLLLATRARAALTSGCLYTSAATGLSDELSGRASSIRAPYLSR